MLDELGWDPDWAALAAGRTGTPARVVRADGPTALLATGDGEVRAAGAGLVTGDWTLFVPGPEKGGPGTAPRLPRRTELVRGAGGRAAARQVLAANVDLVLVLVSLAAPPSAGRLDRLLTVAWDSGAQPVVVLTKADLAESTAAAERDEVAETAGTAPVVLTSTVDGRGLAELRAMLRPGTTAALLGVSGAGKSSLRNALAAAPSAFGPRAAGRAAAGRHAAAGPHAPGPHVAGPHTAGPHDPGPTAAGPHTPGLHDPGPAAAGPAAVAALGRTGKGRHTTTARELTLLPGGGLLLDTPGLRGVQLWAADGGLDRAFADLVELAERCRFRDCRHAGEPGCAISAAVADGTVSARRAASHAALRHEVGWLRDRYDARQRAEQRQQWKRLSKAVRAGRKASPRQWDRPR